MTFCYQGSGFRKSGVPGFLEFHQTRDTETRIPGPAVNLVLSKHITDGGRPCLPSRHPGLPVLVSRYTTEWVHPSIPWMTEEHGLRYRLIRLDPSCGSVLWIRLIRPDSQDKTEEGHHRTASSVLKHDDDLPLQQIPGFQYLSF